ncbi:hypothetical protein GCM10023115_17130 [Pontixanthobacter gangjinensis]|uniref:Lysoplasmalogenase n=1 Tax=Pontixanthobacter gangjinensis TaxID=1028742 RepID=A0A6I4SQ39_9SPHN|nr:lysoplasmalogenase [Pontixanthobacter gangjinensis]MXO56957.1 lysoplasmalogenase [Pontixanthobacter gangjinensis]
MPKRALVEHRPYLVASIASSIAYFVLRTQIFDELTIIALKGAGIAFLAVYAWQRSSATAAKLLAIVLALSALGDMLIEISLEYGGAAFFGSHLVAMSLYITNSRQETSPSQKGVAIALLVITPFVCWILSRDYAVSLYGLALGGMAATAWMSKFPRYRVGIGAVLFIISDWFIFLNFRTDSGTFGLLVWPIYYLGQFLIATGVIQTLRKELPTAAPV